MKRCSRCKTEKPFAAFSKTRSNKDGLFGWCKVCQAAARKERPREPVTLTEKERGFKRQYEKNGYYKNHEHTLQRKRESARKRREQQRSYNYLKAGARRARRLMAEPSWADREAIQAFYREAEILTRITGEPHHVDHIIPLIHPRVCGLHIPANLRVTTATFNLQKGNKFRG